MKDTLVVDCCTKHTIFEEVRLQVNKYSRNILCDFILLSLLLI